MNKTNFYLYLFLIFLLLGCGQCNLSNRHEVGEKPSEWEFKDTIPDLTSSPPPKDFPEFPLPPPQPSATDKIPESYFKNCITLNDINTKLDHTLDRCGYVRKSYFYVPNGFALVTQIEQIDKDGTSKPENERWHDNYGMGEFSLENYLTKLFFAKPGFYRCIVFIISDNYYIYSEDLTTRKQAEEWLISGTNKLPEEIGKISVNNKYLFDVLIYEFKKDETESEAKILIPSAITGRAHLRKSRILEELKQ